MCFRASLVMIAALSAPLALGMFAQPAGDPPAAQTLWLQGNKIKLKTSIYESSNLSSHPVLVVVLHGDLLGFREVPANTYHYIFADEVTRKIDDAVAAAILRPGYRDHSGERSEGELGRAIGDNYTRDRVDAVAGVIEELKARFHPAHTVLVGHSGGASMAGNLLGLHPSVVDGALLVSCDCDVAGWRKHMLQMEPNNPVWSAPIDILSPQDLAGAVSPSVHVALLTGAGDNVVPPSICRGYVEALRKRVHNVTVTIVPGLGHDMLLEPVTYDTLSAKPQVEQISPRLERDSNAIRP
jgi:pimeloyl-ACP methyl ester carboxylesterase